MKRVLLFVVLFSGIGAMAQAKEPDEVMREIMMKIKLQGNAAPVVDYVHWEEAFAALSDVQRKQLKVSSAQQLKEFYRELLSDPTANMKLQREEKMRTAAPGNKAQLANYYSQLEQRLRQQQEEMKLRIEQTTYEVGTPMITGATAVVPLKQTFEGKTSQEGVKMVKSGEIWLLPSVSAVNPANKGPQRAK